MHFNQDITVDAAIIVASGFAASHIPSGFQHSSSELALTCFDIVDGDLIADPGCSSFGLVIMAGT